MVARISKPTEQDLVSLCLQWLKLKGCFVWRQNQGGMSVPNATGKKRFIRFVHVDGISDIIGMTPSGRFLAVECKLPGQKPKDHQAQFLQRIKDYGGLSVCVTSIGELMKFLEGEL